MRKPLAPLSPLDPKRYKRWTDRFGSYRAGVTNAIIDGWLEQFSSADRDLAARILDVVEFFDQSSIYASYRSALSGLTGWHKSAGVRKGNWAFAAMSASAGESGDAMLHHFRIANGIDGQGFNPLFMSLSDLFRLPQLPTDDPRRLGPDDTVVLLDDFSGSGQQICDAWNNPETSFGSFLSGVGRVYLVLVAASHVARKRIASETGLVPIPAHELRESDNVFSEKCVHFSENDRARLLHYGTIASKKWPRGRGDCGLVVVFQHRIPNNSLPILHADTRNWTAIFPRHS